METAAKRLTDEAGQKTNLLCDADVCSAFRYLVTMADDLLDRAAVVIDTARRLRAESRTVRAAATYQAALVAGSTARLRAEREAFAANVNALARIRALVRQ